MRTPSQAITDILGRIRPLKHKESVPLRRAAGRVLAEEVLSDVDLPPFEKSAMDVFAVRSGDFDPESDAAVTLRCRGESRAGGPFDGDVPPGSCVEIYTGAELPASCDAVVMVERSSRDEAEPEQVTLTDRVSAGLNVNHRGEVLRTGGAVYAPGRRLTAADLSVLAAVGCDPVPVFARPRVHVLTTGDELVPTTEKPGRGQIREGNTLYLAAACEQHGAEVLGAGIVRDDEDEMLARFGEALETADALITTGGVSMGKYDLVGKTFEALGVEPVLHKVAIKPGKPIWFGLRGDTPVFGLPGNPVSSLLGYEVFVRPALARMGGAGEEEQAERMRDGVWGGSATKPNCRQQNLPCLVEQDEKGRDLLRPLPWMGSADIVGASRSRALAVIDAETTVEAGQKIRYRPLD